MAWENRNGKRYYYRKRRIGRSVVSEYIGAGIMAERTAEQAEQKRQERLRWLDLQEQDRRIDTALDQAEQMQSALVRATLLLAGYHPHRRSWRRRRDAHTTY